MDQKQLVGSRWFWVLLAIANATPLLQAVLYRWVNGMLELCLFPVIIILLAHLTYFYTSRFSSLLVFEAIRLASFAIGGIISAQQYHLNIHGDGMSLVVGYLLTWVWCILSAVAAILSCAFRAKKYFKSKGPLN